MRIDFKDKEEVTKWLTLLFLVIGLVMVSRGYWWYLVRHENVTYKWANSGPHFVGGFSFLVMAWIGYCIGYRR